MSANTGGAMPPLISHFFPLTDSLSPENLEDQSSSTNTSNYEGFSAKVSRPLKSLEATRQLELLTVQLHAFALHKPLPLDYSAFDLQVATEGLGMVSVTDRNVYDTMCRIAMIHDRPLEQS